MDYSQYFIRDPQICGGEYIIKDTRISVRTILASLAEGATMEEILKDFPSLTEDKVRAVIMFAANAAADDLPTPPTPQVA
mgnify:CR=1 FL=1